MMERDERLSIMDRALFTYTDRLKRMPRQVLRHGCGTIPLWSMYVRRKHHPQNHFSIHFVQFIQPLSFLFFYFA